MKLRQATFRRSLLRPGPLIAAQNLPILPDPFCGVIIDMTFAADDLFVLAFPA